jgi:hypothetical protein
LDDTIIPVFSKKVKKIAAHRAIPLRQRHYASGQRVKQTDRCNRKKPDADDQSAPGSFRKEKRGKKMKSATISNGGFRLFLCIE